MTCACHYPAADTGVVWSTVEEHPDQRPAFTYDLVYYLSKHLTDKVFPSDTSDTLLTSVVENVSSTKWQPTVTSCLVLLKPEVTIFEGEVGEKALRE